MASSSNENQNGNSSYLRSKLKNAFHSSNDIILGISSNISRFSLFSTGSSTANIQSVNTTPIHEDDNQSQQSALALHKLPGTPEPMKSPQSEKRSPITVSEKIKETFKLENLRPALEDLILANESSGEPSTLPTDTPESPKSGFRFKFTAMNQSLPKKLEDCKAFAIRTLGREGHQERPGSRNTYPKVNVESVVQASRNSQRKGEGEMFERKNGSRELDKASIGLSSRSFLSSHSLQATGQDPFDKFKFKHDFTSSGSASEIEIGVGHSTSLDSTDSDPNKKLWLRYGSQTSLQSWASSLSYDSQTDELNEIREFMKGFVEDVFKHSNNINVDKKAEFGKRAQTEQGRLWFARCINAKRGCKCVSEATFFTLIQHFSVMLFECAEADDFSPAKSLMNMCFTYYHEVSSPDGNRKVKEFLYLFLRQHPIWRSLRFWNAAFFDALQCERFMRPVATREQVGDHDGRGNQEALEDELHYQENISFGQLGTFTCNMHSFGLSKEMVSEFLRKQVTIASLREDQVKLLRDNVDRLYSHHQEWN